MATIAKIAKKIPSPVSSFGNSKLIVRRKIVLPNGSLSGANIINVTHQETRRVDITVGVDYESDIRYVKSVLETVAKSHELILKDQEISVFVDNFDSSAITMGMRVWTKSEDYWTVKWDLQEKIKITFDEKKISIPYDRMDVSFVGNDKAWEIKK